MQLTQQQKEYLKTVSRGQILIAVHTFAELGLVPKEITYGMEELTKQQIVTRVMEKGAKS
jgi:hypothetical protein